MVSRIVAGILAVLGVLLLVVGMLAGFTRYEVLDSARFTATADQVRKDPEVAKQLGIVVTDRIVAANPNLRLLRPLVQRTATSVITQDSLTPLVQGAVQPLHQAIVNGDASDAALQLNKVGAEVVEGLRTVRPDLQISAPADLTVGQQALGAQQALEQIAKVSGWVTLASWLSPLIGVLLLALAGALRGGIRGAIRWVGGGLIGAAVLLAIATGLGTLAADSLTATSVATAAAKAGWPHLSPTLWMLAGAVAVIGVVVTAASHLRRDPQRG
ncbi:hypothetical protein [Branchiibius sp. NY16-3462-2]|uniref:hypothetical protein n=1 Tax=Branchiibius sp. NY16-3462-2 TaxID=1807500 RepID=UPI000792B602|nr:hypothetical protein [Branchiibius sp. NY16-3462-2]KYH45051.1 hypothetical protein AZH51_14285 [Branchiibius sp. NY16-3462-2]